MLKPLFLIYNADSGLMNLALDTLHKVFSPKTYHCNLCRITHGFIGEKQDWIKFVNSLTYNIVYMHKDEWEKEERGTFQYPMVYVYEDDKYQEILNAEQINKMELTDLIHFLKHLDT